MLRDIGFDEAIADDDAVAIIVGPNGAGKSFYLLDIVKKYRGKRSVTILSNTPYGRLNGLRGINKFAVGRFGASPKKVIKEAVLEALKREDSAFYHISSILEYCGYYPRFGFRLEGFNLRNIQLVKDLFDDAESFFSTEDGLRDFEIAQSFISRWRPGEVIWIDPARSAHEFSQSREFAAVLRCENFLVRAKLIKQISVFLEKPGGNKFELNNASSGELSLICSLIFLSVSVKPNSIVLIDEPENSLHPAWQREYIGKIIAALAYRNVSVVVATHSPLVVSGALSEHSNIVTVHQMTGTGPVRLNLNYSSASGGGIEAILWKAFEVVTPANHFVSEEIVDAMNRFERDQLSKSNLISLIKTMQEKSFDNQQEDFFDAVLELVDKVDANKQIKLKPKSDD